MIGLILALAGFILAVEVFNVEGTDTTLGKHRIIGIVVMAAGLFQPLNALIRPHAPEPGKPRELLRVVWESCHKGFGYTTAVLAIANIYIGMDELRKLAEHSYWYIAVYSVYVGLLVISWAGLKVLGLTKKE